MVTLTQDDRGNYRARKRLPDDVREEYGRLYGGRYEAKFSAPKTTKGHEAKRLFNDWLVEVEGRIASIRAERDGTGRTLTHAQARQLAGEWYEWFTARHAGADTDELERRRDEVHEAFKSAVSEEEFERLHAEELWALEEVREEVRPVLADIGETAQFFALKQIALTNDARKLFLDFLYADLAAALKLLLRRLEGNYSPDKYADQFPRTVEGTDSGITPWDLFAKWVDERKPAASSIESWRYVFAAIQADFNDRSAGSIMPEEAAAWIKGRVSAKRSARTVANTWLKAARTVFSWAVAQKLLRRNPFAEVRLTVPRKRKLRETQAFFPEERRVILRAAAAIKNTNKPDDAAKRWVPWLCAYTGARPSEITQLRGADVIERDGIPALRITPEAGTVKGGETRVVPLHEHIVAQGFLKFAKAHRGPLFYNPRTSAAEGDPTKQKKPPYAQVRQRLAAWVRALGVDDTSLSPVHAWRHTFKLVGRRAGISDSVLDDICGQAPASIGAGYGRASLDDMAAALKKFPRYSLKGS
jgi:integrase